VYRLYNSTTLRLGCRCTENETVVKTAAAYMLRPIQIFEKEGSELSSLGAKPQVASSGAFVVGYGQRPRQKGGLGREPQKLNSFRL